MKLSYVGKVGAVCASLFVITLAFAGCSAGDTFPCGEGTCQVGTQVCMVPEGGCSTCLTLPAACQSKATCGCVPAANDTGWSDFRCDDEGACTEDEGNVTLTCKKPTWGCG